MVAHKLSIFVLAAVALSSVYAAPINSGVQNADFSVPPKPEDVVNLINSLTSGAAGNPLSKLPIPAPLSGRGVELNRRVDPSSVLNTNKEIHNADFSVPPKPEDVVNLINSLTSGAAGNALSSLPIPAPLSGRGVGLGGTPAGVGQNLGSSALDNVLPGSTQNAPTLPGTLASPFGSGVGAGLGGLTGNQGTNVGRRDDKGGLHLGGMEGGVQPNQIGSVPGQVEGGANQGKGALGQAGSVPAQTLGDPKAVALETAQGAAGKLGVLQTGAAGGESGLKVNGNNVSQ